MKNGFTLIELILYMAIVAVLVGALVPLGWGVIEGGAESAVEQEVYSTARYVAQRIKYEIRNSVGINSVNPGSISLVKSLPGDNPTVISVSSGQVRISRGGGTARAINSSRADVASLVFTNYTSADNSTKHIQFTLTVDSAFPAGRQEYAKSVSLEGSAEVRGN